MGALERKILKGIMVLVVMIVIIVANKPHTETKIKDASVMSTYNGTTYEVSDGRKIIEHPATEYVPCVVTAVVGDEVAVTDGDGNMWVFYGDGYNIDDVVVCAFEGEKIVDTFSYEN